MALANTGPHNTSVPVFCHSACRRGWQDLPSDRWVTGPNTQNVNRGFSATRLGNPRNPISVQKSVQFLGASATACGVAPRRGLSRLMASGWPPELPASMLAGSSCRRLLRPAHRCAELLGQRLRVVACLCRRPSPQLRILACVLICCASSGVQVIYVPAPVRETRLRACVSSGFPPANWPYMPPLLLRLSPLKSLSVTQLQRTTDALHTGRTRSMLTSCANA